VVADVRFGSKADIALGSRHVRFTPITDTAEQDPEVCFVPKADIALSSSELSP
jgi:hypothetical protein